MFKLRSQPLGEEGQKEGRREGGKNEQRGRGGEGKEGRKKSIPPPEALEVGPGMFLKPHPPAASGLEVLALQISKDIWSLPSDHVPFLLKVFPWTYSPRIGESCYLLTAMRLSSILFSRTLPLISHCFGTQAWNHVHFSCSGALPTPVLGESSRQGRVVLQGPSLCPVRTFRGWDFPLSPRSGQAKSEE